MHTLIATQISTFPFWFCGIVTIIMIGAILYATRYGDENTTD